jgi:hypothetical protein
MLNNFLYDSTKALVDYKKSRLYLFPQLQEVWVEIRDERGMSLSLESFILEARKAMEKQWGRDESLGTLSGILQCSSGIPHNEITTSGCSTNFMYGLMLERLRQKRGLSIELHRRQMSSEEMDAIVKEFSQANSEETDEE